MKNYLIIFLFIIMGCSSPLKKTQRYLFEHPEFSSGYCAEQYPVKDSIITKYDTVLEIPEWDDITVYDTITKDSIIYITKTVEKVKTVTKTIYKDSIIYKINSAAEKQLQLQLQACQSNNNTLLQNYNEQARLLASWQGKAKKRWWLIFALIGGAVVYTGLKLKKHFLV